jgi:homoserine dehydrogenase
VRLLLAGVGNVGRRFLELLIAKRATLAGRYGLELLVAGVADSSGVAASPKGLEAAQIVRLKTEGQGVAAYPQWGRPGAGARAMLKGTGADLFIDATPANLRDGQPGLDCTAVALAQGMHVVTANKAPLVLAFPRLAALARQKGVELRYDATVAGGLPAINLGRRDLGLARIERLEGMVNLTANLILAGMGEGGLSYGEALAEAQAAGHAEVDPTLDVEGWDAASKLVILAHSVLGFPATLDDVDREGITEVTEDMLAGALAQGQRIRLVAAAERRGEGYKLSVRPTRLSADHPLAGLGSSQMGIVFHTDICGIVSAAIVEETPVPTAAAVLRDVVSIFSSEWK